VGRGSAALSALGVGGGKCRVGVCSGGGGEFWSGGMGGGLWCGVGFGGYVGCVGRRTPLGGGSFSPFLGMAPLFLFSVEVTHSSRNLTCSITEIPSTHRRGFPPYHSTPIPFFAFFLVPMASSLSFSPLTMTLSLSMLTKWYDPLYPPSQVFFFAFSTVFFRNKIIGIFFSLVTPVD